uniref:Capsid protein 1 n=1 Tax=Coconut foliar decay virus TaxID=12474 RepID=A0A2R4N9D0_9VIRU|nr:capsid protein 1 [Coconut foliar decay virus]AVX29447.1 capsid protein 1 [Coconut foliar decay virus]AVX29449.1 capsid protein 1 [Coconut foliar decay virus]
MASIRRRKGSGRAKRRTYARRRMTSKMNALTSWRANTTTFNATVKRTTCGLLPIVNIGRGPGDDQRVGDSVYLASIAVRGKVSISENMLEGKGCGYALAFVLDRAPTGVNPSLSTIFGKRELASDWATAYIEQRNRHRFRLLMWKTGFICRRNNVHEEVMVHKYVPVRRVITYSGDTSGLGSVLTHAVYMCYFCHGMGQEQSNVIDIDVSVQSIFKT